MSLLVRVGVADNGINPKDPQVGTVEGGVGIRLLEDRLECDDSWQDLLGHGTAVAATIRGHAPSAALYSIRVFRRRLEAPVEALLHAIEWAAKERLELLNLSLGCTSLERKHDFIEACARAADAGVVIVSAAEAWGTPSLPGALEGVVPVRADYDLDGDEIREVGGVFEAAPWARKRGVLPREKNFHGTSFAVANVTGVVARLLADNDGLAAVSVMHELSRWASSR